MNKRCYFCKSEQLNKSLIHRQIKFLENLYDFFKCKSCNGFSLYPKLTKKQLGLLYSDIYSLQSRLESSFESEYLEKFDTLTEELD
jgi:hypothetical protein